MKHRELEPQQGFFPQPIYLIGTKDKKMNINFAPITWITSCSGEVPKIMIAMTKDIKTCENVIKTQAFSANLATVEMQDIINYCGSITGNVCDKTLNEKIRYYLSPKSGLPILLESPWVYECKIIHQIELESTMVFIANVTGILVENSVKKTNYGELDIESLNPIIYAPWKYYSLGSFLGEVN